MFQRKRLRFLNGIPRVETTRRSIHHNVAVLEAPEAVAVFSTGLRVEVAGREVRLSSPLSGTHLTVEDIAGTKLWEVDFRARDAQ